VSFFWGVAVFGEPVRSMSACVLALLLMTVGMAGAWRQSVSSLRLDVRTQLQQRLLYFHMPVASCRVQRRRSIDPLRLDVRSRRLSEETQTPDP
jgi:hypothetical protein